VFTGRLSLSWTSSTARTEGTSGALVGKKDKTPRQDSTTPPKGGGRLGASLLAALLGAEAVPPLWLDGGKVASLGLGGGQVAVLRSHVASLAHVTNAAYSPSAASVSSK
jgi:hypothetical protein